MDFLLIQLLNVSLILNVIENGFSLIISNFILISARKFPAVKRIKVKSIGNFHSRIKNELLIQRF